MEKRLTLRPLIGTGLLLLVPLAMSVADHAKPVGDGWHWSALDFAVMGALLLFAGHAFEFLSAKLRPGAQRIALGSVILAMVLAIWAELAVGGISQLTAWLAN